MASEMVERVCRAMCTSVFTNPDCVDYGGSVPAWRLYEKQARAAIEAMREPTEAMCRGAMDGDVTVWTWRNMIDAALRESTPAIPSASEDGDA